MIFLTMLRYLENRLESWTALFWVVSRLKKVKSKFCMSWFLIFMTATFVWNLSIYKMGTYCIASSGRFSLRKECIILHDMKLLIKTHHTFVGDTFVNIWKRRFICHQDDMFLRRRRKKNRQTWSLPLKICPFIITFRLLLPSEGYFVWWDWTSPPPQPLQ